MPAPVAPMMVASCGFDDENVALRFHHGIEGEIGARQHGLGFRGVSAQERDAIGRLHGGVGFVGGGARCA